MKITAELLELSSYHINSAGLLQLDLRGNRIVELENLFITRDAYEVIDLSDNEIECLEGLPPLANLRELYLSNNSIQRVRINPKYLPKLSVLNLHGNKISDVDQIRNLHELKHLKWLVLTDNPICQIENYQEKIIQLLPNLVVLDYQYLLTSKSKMSFKDKNSKDGILELIKKTESTHDFYDLKRIEKMLASGFIK